VVAICPDELAEHAEPPLTSVAIPAPDHPRPGADMSDNRILPFSSKVITTITVVPVPDVTP
jgi:hypothetical protein